MNKAGLLARHTVFLCSDSDMAASNIPFLEDIHNLVHNGIVPFLFVGDDRKIITDSMDHATIREGAKVTEEHVFDKFVQNVREYLHVVLCLRNTHENMRYVLCTKKLYSKHW